LTPSSKIWREPYGLWLEDETKKVVSCCVVREKGSFHAIKGWFDNEPVESGACRLISMC